MAWVPEVFVAELSADFGPYSVEVQVNNWQQKHGSTNMQINPGNNGVKINKAGHAFLATNIEGSDTSQVNGRVFLRKTPNLVTFQVLDRQYDKRGWHNISAPLQVAVNDVIYVSLRAQGGGTDTAVAGTGSWLAVVLLTDDAA